MSIVQSWLPLAWLPLALSTPFILAAWIAFRQRQRTTDPQVEALEADPLQHYAKHLSRWLRWRARVGFGWNLPWARR
jgi:hypothetical protein